SQQSTSGVIPAVVQLIYNQTRELQQRFPNIFDLGTAGNIMIWARTEGRQRYDAIAAYFDAITPFRKSEMVGEHDQEALCNEPLIEPVFGYIREPPRAHRRPQTDIDLLSASANRKSGRVMRLLQRVRTRLKTHTRKTIGS